MQLPFYKNERVICISLQIARSFFESLFQGVIFGGRYYRPPKIS